MKTRAERIARLSTTDISNALENLVGEMSPEEILATPGVYEVLSEALHNEAIDAALDDETSCCQECNEWIPYDEPSLVNEWHAEDCSLYPSEESESA